MGYAYAWEYEVPAGAEQEFLTHYSPDGTWTRLFRRATGYAGTRLYRDRARPGRFVTIDHWQSEDAFRRFRLDYAAEFDALDGLCARVTRREAHLGEYEVVPIGEARGGALPEVECIVPILSVRRLAESLRYYLDVLGFEVQWGGEADSTMASVARDGCSIMLCEGGQGGPGTWVWIGVEDVDPLHRLLSARGAKIRQTPMDRPWAREMQVEDPDGHVLRFGSEPLS